MVLNEINGVLVISKVGVEGLRVQCILSRCLRFLKLANDPVLSRNEVRCHMLFFCLNRSSTRIF